ncbi:MAG: glucose-1-phosphate adenylyltransferase [Oscillospiraceae bacterium]|nr:glucose-1-phosphate adenylyltransferase [Oscillospiraceae bacterium]
MYMKKECVAMLLAGGQGSRLYVLTENVAKPAVPYGGKYRIIDFPLSNCVNSNIDTVGVLTQYQPLELTEYIGNGQPWDLDRMHGGVHILPPFQTAEGASWYKGTANAIYQNLSFIQRYRPEYVIILSGDHIYKMNYDKMLDFHKEKEAQTTIAVLEVPHDEASRFGIMNTREDGLIYDFEEKPENPKSNLASMGVYIFNISTLFEYLGKDAQNPNSSNDFGKDIIPAMLEAGERLYAYNFDGYWKDVGTLDSLWDANMDLLNPKIPLDIYDPSWKIYSRDPALPPHFIANGAKAENSMITEGCVVEGEVDSSVLFAGVTVGKNAKVHDTILMSGARVEPGAIIEYAIIGENTVIGENALIGARPEMTENLDSWGIAVIGPGVSIAAGETVKPKQII